MPKKPTTKIRKPRAARAKVTAPKRQAEDIKQAEPKSEVVHEHKPKTPGRYVFATGRRKSAIANVRLFAGEGETLVNKKKLKDYFGYEYHQEEVLKPFEVTGLAKDYHFVSHINGGGSHAQAGALRHG